MLDGRSAHVSTVAIDSFENMFVRLKEYECGLERELLSATYSAFVYVTVTCGSINIFGCPSAAKS